MPVWTWFGLRKGRVSTSWPTGSGLDGQAGVLGMPRLEPRQCPSSCVVCVESCPTKAIALGSDGRVGVDYGRCVVCRLCVSACPEGVMTATNDWAFGVRDRTDLIRDDSRDSHSIHQPDPQLRPFGRSVHIRHVDAGSCNGCESEIQALFNPFYNLHRLGIFFTPSPRFADVLLVTGPVTAAMREPLVSTYEAMPEPRWVLACGTCAVSGGTNGGGYACHTGLEGIVPVDVFLPGCPPNPAAIIQALLLLLERAPQHVAGGRFDDA
ncbi:MAG: NADH-quinone oxidoreductase subunit B family protein [Ferrimicrobium sp.]